MSLTNYRIVLMPILSFHFNVFFFLTLEYLLIVIFHIPNRQSSYKRMRSQALEPGEMKDRSIQCNIPNY